MDKNLQNFFNYLIASSSLTNEKTAFKRGEFDTIKLVFKSDYRKRLDYIRYNPLDITVRQYLKILGFVPCSSGNGYRLKEHCINITIDSYNKKILPYLSSTPPYATFDDIVRKIYTESGIVDNTCSF